MKVIKHAILGSLICGVLANAGVAQSYSSPGQSWSAVYGFSSSSDRSVALSQAQAIRAAEMPQQQPVYNTYNDNRSNYIQVNTRGGDASGTSHIGDEIGQQTYSVGASNTSTTNVTIEGNNNSITNTNGATSAGCVDGSIVTSTTSEAGAYVPPLNQTQDPYLTVGDSSTVTSTCAPLE